MANTQEATETETSGADEIQRLMTAIAPQWREQFTVFVETGEASPEFLEYMDTDTACQQAVERAFEIQTAGLIALRDLLASEQDPASVKGARKIDHAGLIAAEVQRLASLPAKEMQQTAKLLKSKLDPKLRHNLLAMLKD
jgi:hypothetical protein